MTRFARAKGSKSSNLKEPEAATSWSELKKGLPSKQQPSEAMKERVSVLKSELKQKEYLEWVPLDNSDENFTRIVRKQMKNTDEGDNEGAVSNNLHSNQDAEVKLTRKFPANKVVTKSTKNENIHEAETENDTVSNMNKRLKKKKRKKSDVTGKQEKKESLLVKKRKRQSSDCEFADEKCSDMPSNQERVDVTHASSSTNTVQENNVKISGKRIRQSKSQRKDGKIRKNNQHNCKGKMKQYATRKPVEGSSVKVANDNSSSKEFVSNFRKNDGNAITNNFTTTISIGGEMVKLIKYQGFYVRKDDADRLKELRRKMVAEGIPRTEIENVIRLERRRCEKALARMKKNVCYHCRKPGHNLSECPEMEANVHTGTGICYKCGSTEHSAFECKVAQGTNYPFAECFICKEKGHIARECPDNPKGLYPRGGCCKLCGDVTHLKKDCPKQIAENDEFAIKLGVIDGRNVDSLDDRNLIRDTIKKDKKKAKKPVQF